jgi:hypothetical protein
MFMRSRTPYFGLRSGLGAPMVGPGIRVTGRWAQESAHHSPRFGMV